MPAKLVPTVKTTYTKAQITKAFVEAWKTMYKEIPKKESIAVIYAQNALETGLTKSMWNNNIGNVKYVANAKDTEVIEYCMLANVWEMVKGKKVTFQPPHPATWFRSFKTLADGVVHHFNFLKNARYKDSWTAVEKGDPAQFAHLLKLKGYYTASEAEYVKLMKYYFNKFMSAKDFEKAVKSLPVIDPIVVVVPTLPPTEPKKEELKPVESTPQPPQEELVVDTTPEEIKPIEISGWQKFEVGLFNFLSAMPWIKLIEWLNSSKK